MSDYSMNDRDAVPSIPLADLLRHLRTPQPIGRVYTDEARARFAAAEAQQRDVMRLLRAGCSRRQLDQVCNHKLRLQRVCRAHGYVLWFAVDQRGPMYQAVLPHQTPTIWADDVLATVLS